MLAYNRDDLFDRYSVELATSMSSLISWALTRAVRKMYDLVAILKRLNHAANKSLCTFRSGIDGHEPEGAFTLRRHSAHGLTCGAELLCIVGKWRRLSIRHHDAVAVGGRVASCRASIHPHCCKSTYRVNRSTLLQIQVIFSIMYGCKCDAGARSQARKDCPALAIEAVCGELCCWTRHHASYILFTAKDLRLVGRHQHGIKFAHPAPCSSRISIAVCTSLQKSFRATKNVEERSSGVHACRLRSNNPLQIQPYRVFSKKAWPTTI